MLNRMYTRRRVSKKIIFSGGEISSSDFCGTSRFSPSCGPCRCRCACSSSRGFCVCFYLETCGVCHGPCLGDCCSHRHFFSPCPCHHHLLCICHHPQNMSDLVWTEH